LRAFNDRHIVGSAAACLSHSDLHGALEFLREAEGVSGPDPFPTELLDRLRELVPCDFVARSVRLRRL
jgi:hypothetical protein